MSWFDVKDDSFVQEAMVEDASEKFEFVNIVEETERDETLEDEHENDNDEQSITASRTLPFMEEIHKENAKRTTQMLITEMLDKTGQNFTTISQ